MLTIAVQKTNDREAAKEIVQSTFVTLFKNKEFAHQIGSMMGYLYTILKNRILDLHRHQLIHKKYEEHITYFHDVRLENNVYNYIETKELEQRLNEEINKLPPKCADVFKLRKQQDLSNKEVAIHLNISENTVEQHMRKALKLLKVAFQYGQRTLLTMALIFVGFIP